MKNFTKPVIFSLLLSGAMGLIAQDSTQPAPPESRRRPAPPVVTALDANQDGVLDAAEIANAANALLTLDKNSDGQLTADEFQPARGEGGRPPGGPGAKRGPRPEAGTN